jgi:hypothetical protein
MSIFESDLFAYNTIGLSVTGKAHIEAAFTKAGVPTSFVHPGFYVQNLVAMMPPRKQDDGSLVLAVPTGDTPMGMIDVDTEFGPIVAGIFAHRDAYLGMCLARLSCFQRLTMNRYRRQDRAGQPASDLVPQIGRDGDRSVGQACFALQHATRGVPQAAVSWRRRIGRNV